MRLCETHPSGVPSPFRRHSFSVPSRPWLQQLLISVISQCRTLSCWHWAMTSPQQLGWLPLQVVEAQDASIRWVNAAHTVVVNDICLSSQHKQCIFVGIYLCRNAGRLLSSDQTMSTPEASLEQREGSGSSVRQHRAIYAQYNLKHAQCLCFQCQSLERSAPREEQRPVSIEADRLCV